MQMPMGAAQIVFLVLTSVVTTYVPSTRVLMMIFNTAVSTVGMILVWKLDSQAGRLTGLVLSCVFAVNVPISLSLVSSNVAGFTKRSVISSMIFVAYCAGNIVGPQFYYSSEAPTYQVRSLSHVQQLHANRINRPDSSKLSPALHWAYFFSAACLCTISGRINGETVSTGLHRSLQRARNCPRICRTRRINR